MSLFRGAALLILCGIALSAVGKSATPQNSETTPAAKPDDIPKSIAESVSGTLQFAEGNFLGLAEAMPEDKYSYIPTAGKFDGVRSFGEQVKHVACAQFAFFNEFEGKKPPEDCEKGGHDPAKSKAEVDQISQGLLRLLQPCPRYAHGEQCARPCRRPLCRAEHQIGYLGHRGLAHHRPLRTACRVPAVERYRPTDDAEIRAEGSLTRLPHLRNIAP
jgi:hypothetical protein